MSDELQRVHSATACLILLLQVMNLLRRHYPAHIMPDLQHYSQRALEDMAEGFPHAHNISRHNLDKFLEVTSAPAVLKPLLSKCSMHKCFACSHF